MQIIERIEAPAAFDVHDAARIMGICRASVFDEIRAGRLEARKFGRKTLITRTAIEAWLDALPVRKPVAQAAA